MLIKPKTSFFKKNVNGFYLPIVINPLMF